MGKTFLILTLIFYYFALNQSFLHLKTDEKAEAESKTDTTLFSTASLAISQFGVNQGWTTWNSFPRILADINGDGAQDMIGFGASTQTIALANGKGGYNTPFTVGAGLGGSGWTQSQYPITACDVNGDGYEDIVGFGYSAVFVALSNGKTLNFATQFASTLTYGSGYVSFNQNPRFCYDIDGDGKADLIGFSNSGIYVQYSTGVSFAPPFLVGNYFTYSQGWTNWNTQPICIGKINNGCGADIIGFSNTGVMVSSFNGRTFNAPVSMLPGQYGVSAGGWATFDQYPRLCVDMNGDGKTDLVAFGNGFVGITYAKADGTFGETSGQVGEDTSQLAWGSTTSFNINPRLAGRFLTTSKYGSLFGLESAGVYVATKTS